ncbi:hypothetical protein CITRIK5_20218 [Citricoccus sp. K5]|nr:hypothetical protein CITRIK5_20218 [Citricoccus sp. K5]
MTGVEALIGVDSKRWKTYVCHRRLRRSGLCGRMGCRSATTVRRRPFRPGVTAARQPLELCSIGSNPMGGTTRQGELADASSRPDVKG